MTELTQPNKRNASTVTQKEQEQRMYNRLFTKILDSSIWLEPSTTRIVWITLLAAMDEEGYAHFSAMENLASRARVSVEEARKAVECFLSPDVNSENTEHEGRRVERVPGGFMVLNAAHHRQVLNREIRREQTRARVAKHRAKSPENVTQALQSVTPASAFGVTSQKGECEGIYDAYPRKVAKPDALRAIQKALKKHPAEFLLERTRLFATIRPDKADPFIPHPATWFNDERFNDDPETWKRSETRVAPPRASAATAGITWKEV